MLITILATAILAGPDITRTRDPNSYITFNPYRARPQTLLMGTHSQARLISHVCGCMEFPLAQGRAILPCLTHDKKIQALWAKVDAPDGP